MCELIRQRTELFLLFLTFLLFNRPLSSNLSTGNRKGFPGIESLERRRLEAKLALDEQTGVKLPSHRNTVSTILEDP